MKRILFLLFIFNFVLLSAAEEEGELAAADNLGPTAVGFPPEVDFGPEDENFVDPKVLRDFIESRGLIETRQKEGKLTLAGDARARWVAANESVARRSGSGLRRVRGQGSETAINRYKTEFNLFMDYVAPCSWVSTKLKFAAFMGKDGGTSLKVELDRAFIGYNVITDCDQDFYIEAGRSKLDFMFESRVQFTSRFDGIHFYYTNYYPSVGYFIIHGGPMIVDTFTNHYAWIVETAVKKWAGTGFTMKYSLIDWNRLAPTLDYGNLKDSGKVSVRDNPRYGFLISQMLLGYERKINFLGCKTLYIYGAILKNHKAKRSTFSTAGKFANEAWYVGFTLGKLCKAYDWSIDINYQSVAAQAIPEFDLSGIGHGNAADTLLSDALLQNFSSSEVRGFTNYRGPQFNLLYALTDSLSLRAKAEWSTPLNPSIGGAFKYKSTEMSIIYAF